MKIFITGGLGFISSSLLKILKGQNHEILLLSTKSEEQVKSFKDLPDNLQVISGSLSNINSWQDKLKTFNPNITIHTAWEGIPDYSYENSMKNFGYSLELYKSVLETDCKRIISTGSCWEYGNQKGVLKETDSLNTNNYFTSSKNSVHNIGKEISRSKGVEFVWLRLFYVYGPGQRENSILPFIIKSLKNNKMPEVKTPFSKNDYVYVDDVSTAILDIIKSEKVETLYNIGSGYSISVYELINIVSSLVGYNQLYSPNFENINSDNFVDFWADITKIKSLGWNPSYSINKGIKNMIDSYSDR